MANLLYVTQDVLEKLRAHPAYQFWATIVQNFPIRLIPLEERSYHPRPIKAEDNAVYLTIDCKFAYCRDGMFSFLYETQDLSFRLTAKDGILRTLDNKQFTALIGKVAVASSSSDVELVETDKVYHPYFDSGQAGVRPPAPVAPSPKPAPAKPPPPPPPPPPPVEDPVETPTTADADGMVLGRFPQEMCDRLTTFRESSKKSYAYLAERFGLGRDDVKAICDHYKHVAQAAARSPATKQTLREVPDELQETIVRMKKVSKKSYNYLADKFDLPIDVVKDICAQFLKRPRRRHAS